MPRLILVGPPGAGKTAVGQAVARLLDVPWRDTDTDIEERAGKPITDIFVEDGEPAFREMERAAVQKALAEHDGVLALGGGAVRNPDTRADLGAAPVVFLDVDLPNAVSRVGLNRSRPLLLDSPRARLRQLMQERRPYYEEVASVTIDTSERTVDDVAEEVARHARSG
ncbi:shikimate kinase [Phytoactinopolyspora halophila]|nr:shikimate kinase [Phytoactinopolyspora halophila]